MMLGNMLRLHWRRIRSRYPWLQMMQTWRGLLLIIFTVVLILYAFFTYHKRPKAYIEQEIKEVWVGNFQIDFQTGLFFLEENKKVFLRGSIPDSQQMKGPPSHCAQYNASSHLCAEWYPYVRLEVAYTVEEHASCESFTWLSHGEGYSHKSRPQTCFSMSDYQWYGGSLLSKQTWPLNKAEVNMQPYVTHDLKNFQGKTTVFGNVMDWFWISSAGVAVMMDSSVPVQVSVNQSNDKLLCFYSVSKQSPALKYKICKAANLRKIHRFVTSKMVHLPVNLPNEEYFSAPLWSSSPLFRHLSQDSLLKYAQDISVHNKFSRYAIEIYDESVSLFKVNQFDKHKYPNLQQMMMLIHGDYALEKIVSISPFVAADENLEASKLLLDSSGNPVIALRNGIKWNILNLLEPKVFEEFVEKVKALKELCDLKGFRLNGGEFEYLPREIMGHSGVMEFSEKFASLAELLKVTTLATFALRSHKYSTLVLLTSRQSSWDGDGGLQSVIPSVLTLGILGYPFVISNVIGGPGSEKFVNVTYSEVFKPDRELYMRWMGLSAYLPIMMFSFPPWLYDNYVNDTAQAFVKIHKEVVSPLVIKAAREYEISGSPIIRPLWWIDPTDKVLETICDQYLIGETLLVAPILQLGSTARDIYIPVGRWKDVLNNVELDGKTWLKMFKIPLNKVATFSKVVI